MLELLKQLCACAKELYGFAAMHEAIVSLFLLAFIVTMPPDVPALSVKAAIRWLYGWLHDALKTFVSFRSPSPTKREQ